MTLDWRDFLYKVTGQGNKAVVVIKIRAVFIGSDRHQTPTADLERLDRVDRARQQEG